MCYILYIYIFFYPLYKMGGFGVQNVIFTHLRQFLDILAIKMAEFFKLEHFLRPFLPMPLAGAWVNRWTFSPLSPSPSLSLSSDFQLFVSVRYRKCRGGHGSLAVYAIMFKTRSHDRSAHAFVSSHRFSKCPK